ncbi:insulinase family protein [Lactobacillus sp. DCY120]|uniref:Insulinase family protein n=1 Tax=Bombilactobacillus apium TaxID=2675299 RepID=A0A850R8F6_9LACO|nr:insulinase family protein [Bombilactobacillus apium]NVY96815.1 insulinase family protein [Bombilactobacillus apium]
MNKGRIFDISSGVRLLWLPTKKFHVARLELNFIAPQVLAKTTSRRLLANLWQRSSASYPTELLLSRRLSALYGTELTAKTELWQNLNVLTVVMTSPLRYQTTDIFKEALQLTLDNIFYPNLNARKDQFQESAFLFEQNNLANAYLSLEDDYALKAALAMRRLLYQSNPDLAVPAFGRAQDLEALNPGNLFAQAQDVLTTNGIIATVVGDVAPGTIEKLGKDLAQFAANYQAIQYQQRRLITFPTVPIKAQETLPLQQSQLAISYHWIQPLSKAVVQVLNMILGGDDQALLFQEVREGAGLAYSIYSTVNFYQKFLTIQAGVDAQKLSETQDLIAKQIKSLAQRVTPEQLHHAQQALLNKFLIATDSIASHNRRLLAQALTRKEPVALIQYRNQILQVTADQIQTAAQSLSLVAEYQLLGADH